MKAAMKAPSAPNCRKADEEKREVRGAGTPLALWHLWVQRGVCVLNKWPGRFSPCASHVRITHAELVTLGSAQTSHKPVPLGHLPRVRPRLCLGPCIFIPGCLFIFPSAQTSYIKEHLNLPSTEASSRPPEPPRSREKDWTLKKV